MNRFVLVKIRKLENPDLKGCGREMNATAGGAVVRRWAGLQRVAVLLACAVLAIPPAARLPTRTLRAWGLTGGLALAVLLPGVSGERRAWGRRDKLLADAQFEGEESTLGLREEEPEERETSRWKVHSRLVSTGLFLVCLSSRGSGRWAQLCVLGENALPSITP